MIPPTLLKNWFNEMKKRRSKKKVVEAVVSKLPSLLVRPLPPVGDMATVGITQSRFASAPGLSIVSGAYATPTMKEIKVTYKDLKDKISEQIAASMIQDSKLNSINIESIVTLCDESVEKALRQLGDQSGKVSVLLTVEPPKPDTNDPRDVE